jgi:hypothetical protein
MPDKSDIPSNFTLKLRKHIRGRRLEAVRQLGVDRVVEFEFGTGENCHHLILEMYSQVPPRHAIAHTCPSCTTTCFTLCWINSCKYYPLTTVAEYWEGVTFLQIWPLHSPVALTLSWTSPHPLTQLLTNHTQQPKCTFSPGQPLLT